MAGDPSHNVHQDLLPHIHLISAYRYPLVPQFGIPDVTEWLLNTPRIARDAAPFFWTYLDAPQDGSIILTWQPLQRMGTEFATDGYIWPRGETYYQHEIRDGLILEVFHQPVGYRPGDEMATHSRRRFRLMPPKVPNPNIPQVDPSLWLVHYGPADDMSTMAVKKIRLDGRIRSLMDHRNALQRAGQITRKEFMLSDRVNWPHIPLPRDARGPPLYGGGAGGGPASAHHVPQQMAYPPHGPGGGGGSLPVPPPSKRARHSAGPHPAAAAGLVGGQPGMGPPPPHMVPQMDMSLFEDEEDTSRGDMFDNITPRDVSLERYKQNHEWMEEVISSPYRIGQIGYADLGLGLQGELAPVTEGIFEGQGSDAHQRVPAKPYVGRLDAGLADEFRRRVTDKIRSSQDEIDKMKAEHERVMANFRKNSVIRAAEHDLRSVPALAPEQEGGMQLESRLDATDGSSGSSGSSGNSSEGHWSHQKPQRSVREIASHVESSLRSKIVPTPVVVRVEAGGYQEPEPEPEPEPVVEPVGEPEGMLDVPAAGGGAEGSGGGSGGHGGASPSGSQISGIMVGEADIDMGDTAASLLDQMESAISPASSTPGNGSAGTPVVAGVAGVSAPPAQSAPVSAATAGPGGLPGTAQDDWVVVPPGGGVSPAGDAAGNAAAAAGSHATTTTTTPIPVSASAPAPAPAPATSLPSASAAPFAAGAPAGPVPAAGGSTGSGLGSTPGMLDGSSSGDFATLTDLDAGAEGLGDLEMDMEESAFGNAFHGAD